MYNLYNHYFYCDEMKMAESQIEFYQDRIKIIKEKTNMNDFEKADKIKKIDFTIRCIKYTFSL